MIPVTYDEIDEAYSALQNAIQVAFAGQTLVNALEAEKADLWAELTSNPDFKPGKSNLEQAAKLRAAFPEFMDGYERAVAALDQDKLAVDNARLVIGRLKAMLDLGKILAAVREDLDE